VSAYLHSPPSTMARCLVCKLPIAERPVVRRWRGERVELHDACWTEIEERHHEQRAFAEGRLVRVLSSLPRFAVSIGSSEFHDRVKQARLVAVATRYQPKEHGCLALIGPAGCGKSVTAAAIVKRLCTEAVDAYTARERDTSKIDAAARIYWTTAADLCNARKQYRLGEGEAPELRLAETAPLLVLDEFGQEIADDRWLLELLDVRYARDLPTLSTSGLTRSQIENRYGSGATRRLIEPKGSFIDLFAKAGG
jgi:DNA replication protein DnaC